MGLPVWKLLRTLVDKEGDFGEELDHEAAGVVRAAAVKCMLRLMCTPNFSNTILAEDGGQNGIAA